MTVNARVEERQETTNPGNKTLVETSEPTTSPDGFASLDHRLRSVGGHLCLEHLERLTERRHLVHS